MRNALFLILCALSSAGCSSSDEFGKQAGAEQTSQASASAVAHAPASAGPADFKDNAERDGASRKFAYSWPAAVGAEPALVLRLTAERDKLLAEQKSDWGQMQADAPPDCASCRMLELQKQWKVVAAIPGWLSLSADSYAFTGGAHGMSGRQSLVWDKRAGRGVDGIELFRSPIALEQALGSKLCAGLDRQRAKKRGAPVSAPNGPGDSFNACPPVSDATVLVGSSDGRKFNRIGIWFGPYVAGPYAEGSYELTFPVDAALIDAVKPEYAGAFAIAP